MKTFNSIVRFIINYDPKVSVDKTEASKVISDYLSDREILKALEQEKPSIIGGIPLFIGSF